MTDEELANRERVIAKLRELAGSIITDDREIALIIWDKRSGRLECKATHRSDQDLQNQLGMWRDQIIGKIAVEQHLEQMGAVDVGLHVIEGGGDDETQH